MYGSSLNFHALVKRVSELMRLVLYGKHEDASGVNFRHFNISAFQDDESIPKELRNTKEYWEILQLKRLKRKRAEQNMVRVLSHAEASAQNIMDLMRGGGGAISPGPSAEGNPYKTS